MRSASFLLVAFSLTCCSLAADPPVRVFVPSQPKPDFPGGPVRDTFIDPFTDKEVSRDAIVKLTQPVYTSAQTDTLIANLQSGVTLQINRAAEADSKALDDLKKEVIKVITDTVSHDLHDDEKRALTAEIKEGLTQEIPKSIIQELRDHKELATQVRDATVDAIKADDNFKSKLESEIMKSVLQDKDFKGAIKQAVMTDLMDNNEFAKKVASELWLMQQKQPAHQK